MFYCYTCNDRDGEIGYQGKLAEERLKRLIYGRLQLDDRDEEGMTAIAYICSYNKPVYDCEYLQGTLKELRYKWLKTLLAKGADPDIPDENGDTPLHHLCLNGDVELVKILVQKGADPYKKNNLGINPLEIAKKVGRGELEGVLVRTSSFFKYIKDALKRLSDFIIGEK